MGGRGYCWCKVGYWEEKRGQKIERKVEELPEITSMHAEVWKDRRERFRGRPNLIWTFSRLEDRVALLKHEDTDQQGVAQWAQYWHGTEGQRQTPRLDVVGGQHPATLPPLHVPRHSLGENRYLKDWRYIRACCYSALSGFATHGSAIPCGDR